MALADAKAAASVAYLLDEASGIALDAVGSIDLIDNNTVGAAGGMFDGARDYEQSAGEYHSHSDDAALSVADVDAFWIVWLNAESLSNFPTIFSKGLAGQTTREYTLWVDTDDSNKGAFSLGNGTNVTTVKTTGALSTSVWHLLIGRHDATSNEIGISIDGGAFVTTAHSGGGFDGTGEFQLGASAAQSIFWDGLLDEFVLGKGYLFTDADASALWNGGTGVAFADWDAGEAFTGLAELTVGPVDVIRPKPRLVPHQPHVWPVGYETAEQSHVDAWQQPYREPVRPPVRLVNEPRWCGVLEPSLFTAPPGVSWWEQASEPVRVRVPLVPEGIFVHSPDVSFLAAVPELCWYQPLSKTHPRAPLVLEGLWIGAGESMFLPPALGWSVPLDTPRLRPAMPIRGGESRVDIVEQAEEVTVGWDRPAELPTLRRGHLPGVGAGVIEQTLFTAPPELSWFQPASEPVRTKPPPRWQWATLIVGVDLSGYVSTASIGRAVESEVFVSAMVRGQTFTPGAVESEIKQF